MMQRHKFAKGYITHRGTKYVRVEESYDGQDIEVSVGDDDADTECTCDCGCSPVDVFTVNLSREVVREFIFTLNQLHFIDKERK